MSTLKVNEILHSDGTDTTEPSIPALDKRMVKAWLNFDGPNATIRDDYNISSVTDNGVGLYVVNYAITMASSVNYQAMYCCSNTSGSIRTIISDNGMTSGTIDLRCYSEGGTAACDPYRVFLALLEN